MDLCWRYGAVCNARGTNAHTATHPHTHTHQPTHTHTHTQKIPKYTLEENYIIPECASNSFTIQLLSNSCEYNALVHSQEQLSLVAAATHSQSSRSRRGGPAQPTDKPGIISVVAGEGVWLSPELLCMTPLLRFLQLLCENHNTNLRRCGVCVCVCVYVWCVCVCVGGGGGGGGISK